MLYAVRVLGRQPEQRQSLPSAAIHCSIDSLDFSLVLLNFLVWSGMFLRGAPLHVRLPLLRPLGS